MQAFQWWGTRAKRFLIRIIILLRYCLQSEIFEALMFSSGPGVVLQVVGMAYLILSQCYVLYNYSIYMQTQQDNSYSWRDQQKIINKASSVILFEYYNSFVMVFIFPFFFMWLWLVNIAKWILLSIASFPISILHN